jgi:hypothetical protein
MFTSKIIGALPRMGKISLARLLILGAALDPTCELHNGLPPGPSRRYWLFDLERGAC